MIRVRRRSLWQPLQSLKKSKYGGDRGRRKKMIKCCIFDLDGTLLYTLTTITHYVNLVLTRHGIRNITEEQCRIFIGDGARQLISRSLMAAGIDDSEMTESILNEYNGEYNKNTNYLTRAYDGIDELLSSLGERGVKLAVLSNKPDTTTGLVVREIFSDAFDKIYGARAGGPLKPAPDALINLIGELSLTPSEVMYIGDTGVDMQCARAAGVAVAVGVAWGYRSVEELLKTGADIIADAPANILREVERRA